MKSRFLGMRALATGAVAAATSAFWGVNAFAEDLVGQPTPGAIDLQPGVTPLRHDAIFFHNTILLPIITAISLLVLGLLIWVMIRYNKRANPTPAKFSHNTTIEVIWTLAPVLILVFIAIFSFKLLFAYHDMPKPDLTVKATGYQWYWGYEYPDQKVSEVVSNMLPEEEAKAKGLPYRLAATEPLVVPVNKTVRVLVTGADVIHAFGIPSFGVLVDAIHEAGRAFKEGTLAGVVFNAGAYTHTSIALHDAIKSIKVPVIEVHLSDPMKREPFRHVSYVGMAAKASFAGFGAKSYALALDAAAKL